MNQPYLKQNTLDVQNMNFVSQNIQHAEMLKQAFSEIENLKKENNMLKAALQD